MFSLLKLQSIVNFKIAQITQMKTQLCLFFVILTLYQLVQGQTNTPPSTNAPPPATPSTALALTNQPMASSAATNPPAVTPSLAAPTVLTNAPPALAAPPTQPTATSTAVLTNATDMAKLMQEILQKLNAGGGTDVVQQVTFGLTNQAPLPLQVTNVASSEINAETPGGRWYYRRVDTLVTADHSKVPDVPKVELPPEQKTPTPVQAERKPATAPQPEQRSSALHGPSSSQEPPKAERKKRAVAPNVLRPNRKKAARKAEPEEPPATAPPAEALAPPQEGSQPFIFLTTAPGGPASGGVQFVRSGDDTRYANYGSRYQRYAPSSRFFNGFGGGRLGNGWGLGPNYGVTRGGAVALYQNNRSAFGGGRIASGTGPNWGRTWSGARVLYPNNR